MSNSFRLLLGLILCFLEILPSCGRGGGPSPSPIGVSLSVSSVTIYQDGTAGSVDVTLTRPAGNSNSVTLSVQPAIDLLRATVQSPGTGNTGKVTFTTGGPLPPPGSAMPFSVPAASGTYNLTLKASDGTSSGSAAMTLVVGVAAVVWNGVDTTQGVGGRLQEAISTSFQPASWADSFFIQNPSATTPLGNLLPHHLRLQALERDIPETSSGVWDFAYLDAVVNPVMSVGDHSPEFQIARAPAFMYDASGNLLDSSFNTFAGYAADLVRYYNTSAGIVDATSCNKTPCVSTPPNGVGRVDYWGIYNEPNINDEFNDSAQNPQGPQNYVNMYNVVVPQMQSVDPTLKFVAVELADFGSEATNYIPTFVQNVNAQVNVLATHFYATCNQKDSDQQLFDAIDLFVPHIQYLYSQLQTRPALAGLPVWMTENNVNADYDKGGGISACNGTPFVTDLRGSSAFFAAWRPTAFSRFGKVGLQAMYHWDFPADAQFGEVNASNAALQLSYWVDYWLGRYFPSDPDLLPPSGENILQLGLSENSSVEVLAVQNADGSVVVMVANHAVHASTDNNGQGDPRLVAVDLSALGTFSSASMLIIDKNTSVTTGPAATPVTPAAHMTIQLGGYGVALLNLVP